MHLIELTDYFLEAIGAGNELKHIKFELSKGDICFIQTDVTDDAHNFLKALATLIWPASGTYRFMGKTVNFSDYRKLLPLKKKIGYIGQDAAMISNRTVLENLLLMRCFFENSLTISLDDKAVRLCKIFNLEDKLNVRPGTLRVADLRHAIVIRELTKTFDVLLLDRPEDYFGYSRFDLFNEILEDIIESQQAVVFFSRDRHFIETFTNRKILITGGSLIKVPI